MTSSLNEKKKKAYKIFESLKIAYPDSKVLLNYQNAFELLIATILAAQCTDDRVNSVTPALFKQYPDSRSMAHAELGDLERIIKPTGFFKNKAKSLKRVSNVIEKEFSGELPETIEELATLPGVGRKTANVVAGNCFRVPAIIVDTHLKRVSNRLQLSNSKNPDKIEMELRNIILENNRTEFSYAVNFHGRFTCKARRPLCSKCEIVKLCPYPDKNMDP